VNSGRTSPVYFCAQTGLICDYLLRSFKCTFTFIMLSVMCYATGPRGPDGPSGSPGSRGATGSPGASGSTGDPGPLGATGPEGPVGPVGVMGPPGMTGSSGATGSSGRQGDVGAAGDRGSTGSLLLLFLYFYLLILGCRPIDPFKATKLNTVFDGCNHRNEAVTKMHRVKTLRPSLFRTFV